MFKSILLCGAVLGSAAVLGAAAPAKKSGAPAAFRRPAPVVRLATVTSKRDTVTRKYVGKTVALLDATLVARITGYIEKQPIPHGAAVKKGDVIVELEDTVYKAKVQSASAMVKQTEAELVFAESTYNRQKTLYDQKAASQSTFEEAQKLYNTTKAKLEYYKALLIQAQDDLKYTKISAPFDGRIGKVQYSPGNYVVPGKAMVQLVTITPVNVDFAISLSDYLTGFGSNEALKKNGVVTLVLADGSTYPGKGKIIFADNKVDTTTDTLQVRAVFEDPEGKLIPGALLTVLLGKNDPPLLPAIPPSSILTDRNSNFVYVVGTDGKAMRRQVKLGSVIDNMQLITEGLKPGEKVVSEGTNKVIPNMPVKAAAPEEE